MPEWVDPLDKDEAHQAWKAARARMETLKDVGRKATQPRVVWNSYADQLVTCMDCKATFAYSTAAQHELEWH